MTSEVLKASYPLPYKTGRGLSLMPPSTLMYVRIPGISFTVPTRYTVIADDAAMARPGSTETSAVTPSAAQASSNTEPHIVIDGASSPSV